MKYFLHLLLIIMISACSQYVIQEQEEDLPLTLEEAVRSSFRSEVNQERDQYQHPIETLHFFGVTPEMTVVEIAPGAGYYTEILAPFLARHGQYVMAVPRMPTPPPAFMVQNERILQEILLRNRVVQEKTKFISFEPLNKKSLEKLGQADMVLSFTHLHTWVAKKRVIPNFKFCYDILRPGGILGIVQHRIKEGKRRIPKSGYLTEAEVIAMAQRAGFRLVARSEVNANPKDTADYPLGVWTLPPTYRLGETDKDKYEAIGESDRMTLKFVKPKDRGSR